MENIIKVKLGDIKSSHLLHSMESLMESGRTLNRIRRKVRNIWRINHTVYQIGGYGKQCHIENGNVNLFSFLKKYFFVLLFGLVGVLLTILLHRRCFSFFRKFINSEYIYPGLMIIDNTYKLLGNGVIGRLSLIMVSMWVIISKFILISYKIFINPIFLFINFIFLFLKSYRKCYNNNCIEYLNETKIIKYNGYRYMKTSHGFLYVTWYYKVIIEQILKEDMLKDIIRTYDWIGLYKSLKDNGYNPNKFPMGYIKVDKPGGEYRCRDGNHRHRILLDMYGPDKIIDVIYNDITH